MFRINYWELTKHVDTIENVLEWLLDSFDGEPGGVWVARMDIATEPGAEYLRDWLAAGHDAEDIRRACELAAIGLGLIVCRAGQGVEGEYFVAFEDAESAVSHLLALWESGPTVTDDQGRPVAKGDGCPEVRFEARAVAA